MKTINLTKGYSAIVDDADYEEISKHKWHVQVAKHTAYAMRWADDKRGKKLLLAMHREILGLPPSAKYVDHINHNGLDNRRSNLREATPSENGLNKRPTVPGGRSKYKGVFWDKDNQQWAACITKNCKIEIVGLFTTEEEAAMAYDLEAKSFWGELADLNF